MDKIKEDFFKEEFTLDNSTQLDEIRSLNNLEENATRLLKLKGINVGIGEMDDYFEIKFNGKTKEVIFTYTLAGLDVLEF